jgi:hypothetical protein
MKWTLMIFAIGAAALAFTRIPAIAAEGSMQAQVSGTVQPDDGFSQSYRHPRARRDGAWEIYEGPRACSAVKFPRSALCASVPARFSPYGIAYPWVAY